MVDLGLGAEQYKDHVTNQTRKTLYLTLKTSATGHAYEIVRNGAAELAKISPKLEQTVRSAQAVFESLRKHIRARGVRQTLDRVFQRALAILVARDEVVFYELVSNLPPAESSALSIHRIDLDLLADAAMQYGDDENTLAYLLRCAARLHVEGYTGFVLSDSDGHPVHFAWVGPFAGFHWSELNGTLPAPSPDSILIFDSWTPVSQRGKGYYGLTIGLVAARMRQQGKQPWIFSAATNTSSVRGLEKLGFPRRFSIVRHKVLWWQRLSRHKIESAIDSEALAAY
jgi:hypothetical protein